MMRRRWYRSALGALALVCAVVALGLLLEHTAGPGWGGGNSPRLGRTGFPKGASHSSTVRIGPDIKAHLISGGRPGGRFGGFDLSNLNGLLRAILQQLAIGAAVVAVTMLWRRLRRRRRVS